MSLAPHTMPAAFWNQAGGARNWFGGMGAGQQNPLRMRLMEMIANRMGGHVPMPQQGPGSQNGGLASLHPTGTASATAGPGYEMGGQNGGNILAAPLPAPTPMPAISPNPSMGGGPSPAAVGPGQEYDPNDPANLLRSRLQGILTRPNGGSTGFGFYGGGGPASGAPVMGI